MATMFDTYERTYRNMLFSRMLMKECRLKTLRDLCLDCVGKNLHCITRSSQYLAPLHKELIIERLAFHDRFTESYLPHVTYNLFSPRLERINLYKCDQINDKWMQKLAESKCRLRFLTIHQCENVKDQALLYITLGQDKLIELELRKLKITKKGILNIKSPRLEKLDFRGCGQLDNIAIQTVVSANPSIKYVNLVDCTKLTQTVFPIIAQHLKSNLEYLDVAELHMVSDASVLSLANHCPNLKCLNVLGCRQLTEASVMPLFEKCEKLQSLDLSFCAKLVQSVSSSRQIMQNLPSMLEELCLNGIQPIDDTELFVAGLSRLDKLIRLKLCGVPALNNDTMQQIMQNIGGQLEYFDISGSVMSSITDDGMRSVVTYCKQLDTLGISLVKGITGISLLPMLENQKRALLLRRLMLSLRNMDVSVIHAVVDNCYNLQHIDISGLTVITDEILTKLATNCPHLNNINIKGCKHVTDEGILALAANCPLCVVGMSGLHNITDKSIIAIANNCPYIEELYISGCGKVSKGAVTYLTEVCIPRVCVIHRLPSASTAVIRDDVTISNVVSSVNIALLS